MALATRQHTTFDSTPEPESPPYLSSSSKSSKSGSYRTSSSLSLSDLGAEPCDPSHFEDITLDDLHAASAIAAHDLFGDSHADTVAAEKENDTARFGRRHGRGCGHASLALISSTRGSTSSISSRGSARSDVTMTANAPIPRNLTNSSNRPHTSNAQLPPMSTGSTTSKVMENLRGSRSELHLPASRQRAGTSSPVHPMFGSAYNVPPPSGAFSRSPSPTLLQSSGLGPNAPRRTGSKQSLNNTRWIGPRSRRGSWQPGRKSVQELEDEYRDSDEDVDEAAVIWNVPLSPRPPHSRPMSMSLSSPELERYSPTLSIRPTPLTLPMPYARQDRSHPQYKPGSLHHLRRQRSTPASLGGLDSRTRLKPRPANSRGPSPSPSATPRRPSQPQASNDLHMMRVGISTFNKTRTKSWSDAMRQLSQDARHLTQALEALEVHQLERSRAQERADVAVAAMSPTLSPDLSPANGNGAAFGDNGNLSSIMTNVNGVERMSPPTPAELLPSTHQLQSQARLQSQFRPQSQPSPQLQPQLPPSVSTAPSGKTVVTLPPVRKGEVMIDPLPVSKEKEKVLTRTRPSWLPPKDPREERKHLREWKRMMEKSAAAERKRTACLSSQAEARVAAAASLQLIWQNTVLTDWDVALSDPRTRELWWRGVPGPFRAEVWRRAIGNELQLSELSFVAALERARKEEDRLRALVGEGRGQEMGIADGERLEAFERLRWDVKELGMQEEWTAFAAPCSSNVGEAVAEGPLHKALINVLVAYSAYRSDVGYVTGLAGSAALMLLGAGMGEADAFCALGNLWNWGMPMGYLLTSLRARSGSALLRRRRGQQSADVAKSHAAEYDADDSDAGDDADARIPPPPQLTALHATLLRTLSAKLPALRSHLDSLALKPRHFIDPLLSHLLTDPRLGLARMTRLWDILVFEGEKTPVRGIVALLGALEGRLLVGGRREVLGLLGWGAKGAFWGELTGGEEEWVGMVKDAGRVERRADE